MRTRTVIGSALLFLVLIWGGGPAWGACTAAQHAPGDVEAGALDASDCAAQDGTYYDIYQVSLPSSGTLTINMTSTQVDTYLLLYSGYNPDLVNDTPIAWDDDSGGGANGTNSQIVQALAAGTYTIIANSYDVQTGGYTLTSSFQSSGGGTLDISGTWTVTETVYASACGDGTYTDSYNISVTQSGSNITVTASSETFYGTISGNTVSWTGSYPEDGGTTTLTAMNVTINSTATSGSGNSSWTWSNGSSSCSGTTDISLTKGGSSGGGLDVSGTWRVNETVYAAACGQGTYPDVYDVSVTQSGDNITVTASSGTFYGTISGNTISWTGSYPDEGGTTTITAMNVTINSTATSGSGNASWTWTDGSDSCSGSTDVVLTKSSAGGGGSSDGGGGGGGGGCFLQQVGSGW